MGDSDTVVFLLILQNALQICLFFIFLFRGTENTVSPGWRGGHFDMGLIAQMGWLIVPLVRPTGAVGL